MMNHTRGFTLIELMITVAIIGILSAIAYPSYRQHVLKTNREEAKRTLIEASQILERYYAMNVNYSGALATSTIDTALYTPSNEFTSNYTLTMTASKNSFTLTATPQGGQTSDACGVLTMNSRNQTTPTTDRCW